MVSYYDKHDNIIYKKRHPGLKILPCPNELKLLGNSLLNNLNNLTILKIKSNTIINLNKLCSFIKHTNSLKELDLSDNKINHFNNLCKSLIKNKSIEYLNISNCRFKELFNIYKNIDNFILKENDKLYKLNNYLYKPLIYVLKFNKSIKKLNIYNTTYLTLKFYNNIFKYKPNLELIYNDHIPIDINKYMTINTLRFINFFDLYKINMLKLYNIVIDDNIIKNHLNDYLKNNHNLIELDIINSTILNSNEFNKYLQLSTSLTSLSIKHIYKNNTIDLNNILEPLKNIKSLQQINFTRCLTKINCNKLIDLLTINTSINDLNISQNIIFNNENDEINFYNFLKNNTTLTNLNLHYTRITKTNELTEALKYNSTLTSLNLNSNESIKIGEILKHNCTLTKLKINCMKYDNVYDFMDGIQYNTTLTYLSLSSVDLYYNKDINVEHNQFEQFLSNQYDKMTNDIIYMINIFKNNTSLTFINFLHILDNHEFFNKTYNYCENKYYNTKEYINKDEYQKDLTLRYNYEYKYLNFRNKSIVDLLQYNTTLIDIKYYPLN